MLKNPIIGEVRDLAIEQAIDLTDSMTFREEQYFWNLMKVTATQKAVQAARLAQSKEAVSF